MKTLIMTTAAVLALTGMAQADAWTFFKNSQLEERTEGVKAYRIPTQGFDVRVYEFIPVDAPDHICVMAFGKTHPVGMQCMPMGEDDE